MIPLIALGLGGLVWYAQRAQGEPDLDPGMSATLRQEVLALMKRELTPQQLNTLVDELGRAHYHRAQKLFAARLRRAHGSGQPLAAERREPSDVAAALADETNPVVLRRVAAVLAGLGQQTAAARAEARATELEAAAPPANIDELLSTAGGATRSNSDLRELEAELGRLERWQSEDQGEDDPAEPEEEKELSDQEAIDAAMDAAERAAKPSPTPSHESAAEREAPSPGAREATAVQTEPNPSAPQNVPGVIVTAGVELTERTTAPKAKRRRQHRRAGVEEGEQHRA